MNIDGILQDGLDVGRVCVVFLCLFIISSGVGHGKGDKGRILDKQETKGNIHGHSADKLPFILGQSKETLCEISHHSGYES